MEITVILTYGFLFIALIAIWLDVKINGKFPLWIGILAIALAFAVSFKYANIISIAYTSIFGFVIYLFYNRKSIIYTILAFVLSIPLLWHLSFTGFNNFQFLNSVRITPDASPYSLYFNFDKTLIAIFVIGFACPIQKIDVLSMARKLIIYLIVMVTLLLGIAFVLAYTRIEPKIPSFTIVWMLVNLFFVCTAEEALFRKLIQDKVNASLKSKYSYIIAILISAILFGLAHYKGGVAYIALASIAGLFYAHIYYKTGRVESSILLHFLFNLVHFIFFTYPSL